MKKSKIWIIIGIASILLLLLTFASPFLIMYYAEEQYFIDQYKKNKAAFEDVKNELLLILEETNATELNLVVSYDSEKGCILQYYNRTTYYINNDNFIDANGESYSIVDKSFGDYGLSKIYVTHNYICLSEEGNNYQYIYSVDFKPDAAHYAPQDDDKIHKLGNHWYLITQN